MTKFAVAPAGRARSLPSEEFYLNASSEERLFCPGLFPTVYADYQVYPCCAFGIFETSLSVGDIRTISLDDVQDRIEKNIVFMIMQREGLGWFLDKARQAGVEGIPVENFPVAGACHLCHLLFSNPNTLQALRNDILEYKETVSLQKDWR